jgi:hypothetical protein
VEVAEAGREEDGRGVYEAVSGEEYGSGGGLVIHGYRP